MAASFFVETMPSRPAVRYRYNLKNFELVIDLKSAKMLGIDLRPTLLATADDVIE